MQTPFKYLVMILFYSPTSWGSNVLKSDICNAENKDVLCSLFAVIVLLHCICKNVLVQLKHSQSGSSWFKGRTSLFKSVNTLLDFQYCFVGREKVVYEYEKQNHFI